MWRPLISLAASAGVTERIGLMTNILIAPLRHPVLLAEVAASVDRISGGRLTLGLAVGGRPDDYEAVGASFHDQIISGTAKSPGELKEIIERFEAIGVDELVFDPAIAETDQIDELAGAVL